MNDARPYAGSIRAVVRRRLDEGLVERPRLLARLDLSTPLTLLRAPVGFGKTILVGQWLSQSGPRVHATETVAWVRVRPECGGANDFWATVVDALGDAGLPLPSLSEHRSPRAVADRMLTSGTGPLRLVVDGFENVTAPHIDAALLDAVRHTTDLRLTVCLRSHRHFPDWLYTDLEATLLSATDLLFTVEETAAVVTAAGLELSSDSIDQLHAATGGWPEPTQSATVKVRDTRPVPADLTAVTTRIATDYLHHRLLPGVNRPDRLEFALLSSLPDELTLPVAEALAGGVAKSQLEWLEGQGILLTATSADQPVYRWPDAARHALREEAHYRFPERLPELHSRLARCYLDNEEPGRALHHAVQARNWSLVIRVIDSSWRSLLVCHRDELFEAFTVTPLEMIATSPRALALRDLRLSVPDDRLLEVASLPATLAELSGLGASERAAEILDTGIIVTAALRRRGLFVQAANYADRLAEIATVARAIHPGDVVADYPTIQLSVGLGRMLNGNLIDALHPLELAHEFANDNVRRYVESDAASKLALTYAVLGEPDRAHLWLDRYRAAPLGSMWFAPMVHVTATAARLLVALDQLDGAAAAEAHEALPLPERTEEFWAYILYAQAQYAQHTGAVAGMLDRLDRARTAYRHWLDHGAGAGPLLAAAEADLLLAAGRGNQAHAILHGRHARHALLQVGSARLALLAGDYDAAQRLAVDRGWERIATARDRLEMLLIHTVAAHRTGDRAMAIAQLGRAVGIAGDTGLVRPFAGVPRDDLAALAADVPEATRLLSRPTLATARNPYPESVTLVLLTDREQHVLEKLAQGLTAEQTATELVVSYNTVRSHIQNLYRKLGTEARADALARARRWGLLDSRNTSTRRRS